jgi:hypothetical protein
LPESWKAAHPLTTGVRVAAKLSIEGDPRLATEAVNYEKFPKHFFDHWSGYNILPPYMSQLAHSPHNFMDTMSPATIEEQQAEIGEGKMRKQQPKYLSPILLLVEDIFPLMT